MIPKVLRYKVVILEVLRGYFHDVNGFRAYICHFGGFNDISIILKILKVFYSFWGFLDYFDHFARSRPEKWVKLVGFRFDLFVYVWVKLGLSKLKWVTYLTILSRSYDSYLFT